MTVVRVCYDAAVDYLLITACSEVFVNTVVCLLYYSEFATDFFLLMKFKLYFLTICSYAVRHVHYCKYNQSFLYQPLFSSPLKLVRQNFSCYRENGKCKLLCPEEFPVESLLQSCFSRKKERLMRE